MARWPGFFFDFMSSAGILLEMKRLIRRKKVRLQLVLTGVAFLFGGIASLDNGNIPMAAVHFLVVLLNMLAATVVMKHPLRTNMSLFVVNAAFAGVLSYLYYRDGNNQMPYAWGLISVIYIVGSIVYYYRSKRRTEPSP